MRIVVIGSGFGGLAAAIRLQAQGHQVTIVEKLDKPGGRAYVFEQDGFTFDGGPTIITAPWVLDELFALTGKKTEDYIKLVLLDPFYNIRFEDGTVFHYNGDKDEIFRQVEAFSPRDVDGYARFRKKSWEIFNVGMPLIDKPFLTLGSMIKAIPDLVRTRADRSVAGFAEKYIRDERLKQVFSFHPLLVGGNPYRSSSVYALIHKLEQQWGVLFAMGGTGALVRALIQAFEDLGGELRLNSEVDEILVGDNRRTNGVRLKNGQQLRADAVVCNGDLVQAYRTLIAPEKRPSVPNRKVENLQHSMSLFVIYFGTNKQYPGTAHHEIIMGPRYKELLEDIFENKVLAEDFSLYLHRPTATDPSMAPEGCDAFYVLSPVPHLESGTNWETEAERYRKKISRYLSDSLLPGLEENLVTSRVLTPQGFHDEYLSLKGAAFSIEPVLLQSAFFRPHNQSEDVDGLYLVGAGTHPGAGLPGVLSSARVLDSIVPDPAEIRARAQR